MRIPPSAFLLRTAARATLLAGIASSVARAQCPVPAPAPQRAQLAPHAFPSFRMSVPRGADVHPIASEFTADSVASFMVRHCPSLTEMYVTVFRLPKGGTLRSWVRHAFLEDSTNDAQNDEGTPGPIRAGRLARRPAWRFAVCPKCQGFTIYAAHAQTAVAIGCRIDDTHRDRARQLRRNCEAILATFRWRGA